jgi:hypothetical protein
MQLREDAILADYQDDPGFISLIDQHDMATERHLRFTFYILQGANLFLPIITLFVLLFVRAAVARLAREHNEFLRRLLV